MADSQLGWSDAQWELINNAVSEAFDQASVAAAFIPRYGPLAGNAENARREKLRRTGARISVADDTTLKLFNLRVFVELSSEQVADDALSSALLAFRRAANTLAQVEDEIVFNGYEQSPTQPAHAGAAQAAQAQARAKTTAFARGFVASDHPDKSKGLSEPDATPARSESVQSNNVARIPGELVVSEVVKAIGSLEDRQHPGPFAAVLGTTLHDAAYTPNNSLALPADRITPMLRGPLLRSGRLSDNRGIVVSLSAGAIDIVVATPPKVQFLQQQQDAKYLFRVYERFVLRIKDDQTPAVVDFEITGI